MSITSSWNSGRFIRPRLVFFWLSTYFLACCFRLPVRHFWSHWLSDAPGRCCCMSEAMSLQTCLVILSVRRLWDALTSCSRWRAAALDHDVVCSVVEELDAAGCVTVSGFGSIITAATNVTQHQHWNAHYITRYMSEKKTRLNYSWVLLSNLFLGPVIHALKM